MKENEREELYDRLKEFTGIDVGNLPVLDKEWVRVLDRLLDSFDNRACNCCKNDARIQFFMAACDSMPNPIFIKNDELRFLFFNRAYREFFGLEEGENLGKKVLELTYLSETERERYHSQDKQMLDKLSIISYDTEYMNANQEKVEAMYWSRGFEVPGTGQRGLIGEIVNINKEKEIQRQLEKNVKAIEVLLRDTKTASNIDPLTKLYNRNIMDEELLTIIQTAHAMGQPVCLMLIDIDYFKQVNDVHGHGVGDEILKEFGKVLRDTFRQKDIAVRYGGDEFLLLMPGTLPEPARKGAERLREGTRQRCLLPDGKYVTLSIGISLYQENDTMEEFIAKSDEALYESKKNGRDRITVRE